ncbi:MAG: hypothetical protein ACRC7S_00635 [Cetobacterium sp.]
MAYDAARDFISIGSADFTNVLEGDNAFQYTARTDTIITRKDSGGTDIDFKATDKGGTGQITVRHDAKSILKTLQALKQNGNATTIKRDNRNDGGERVQLTNVRIINEGQKGKSSDGQKDARTFMFKYEREIIQEGVY